MKTWQIRLYHHTEMASTFTATLVMERFSFDYSTSDLGGFKVRTNSEEKERRLARLLSLFQGSMTEVI